MPRSSTARLLVVRPTPVDVHGPRAEATSDKSALSDVPSGATCPRRARRAPRRGLLSW